MELDPDEIFGDDEDDSQPNLQERESSKEYVVYIVDASPKMFSTTCPGVNFLFCYSCFITN
ncbi:hypothetical protein SOVF_103000 [Spinacia oleracea]|nr:hypothetical protein SOVF_103000 [Spinacia oleracea]